MRKITFALIAVGVLLIGCSKSDDESELGSGGNLGLFCSATINGSVTSTQIPLSVTVYGGSGSYSISTLTYNGVTPSSISGGSSFNSSTSITAFFSSTINTTTGTGTVSVSDLSDGSMGSCRFTAGSGSTGSTTGSTTSGSYPTCTMGHTVSGSTVTYTITSDVAGTISFSSFNPGSGGSYTSLTHPVVVTYSTSGTKYPTATVSVNGQPCNGSGIVYDTVTVTGGGSTSISCTLSLSPQYAYRGSYVIANALVVGGVGPYYITGLFATSGYGITGWYSGYGTQATLYFPMAGTFQVLTEIQDSVGNTTSCTNYEYIYW